MFFWEPWVSSNMAVHVIFNFKAIKKSSTQWKLLSMSLFPLSSSWRWKQFNDDRGTQLTLRANYKTPISYWHSLEHAGCLELKDFELAIVQVEEEETSTTVVGQWSPSTKALRYKLQSRQRVGSRKTTKWHHGERIKWLQRHKSSCPLLVLQ